MASTTKEVDVAVIGAGGVGACFLKQLAYLAKSRPSSRIRLCYFAIIDRALCHDDYSDIDIDNALSLLDSDGFDPPQIPDVIKYLSAAPGKVIVVDNTASGLMAASYPEFLKNGISTITPNKKAFSGSYQLCAGGSFVYHETSVGAGMPIISTLNELIETGDQVTLIEGVFSGTMSFLFNSFSPPEGQGGKWSIEVKKAKELGYTEPDPRDDLNGLDVARKITILARLAGLPIESPSAFPVQNLIPKELQTAISSKEFLQKLPDFDHILEKEREEASKVNKVVRFVGKVDIISGEAKVGLKWFEKSHPIANLQGSDNIINFYTKRYGNLPLTIRGAGAGGEVTAMGVTGDLLKILRQI
ncbi:unnamed protein product [Clonostachys rhizophaga]|uniref:Homoserine dehydrogenase n=1 Tax=Clonostachys rhizophaga TaxID=160324 RepID=A0A9N9YQG0_9HYPO|nr:unnamed protein product [Clonostachys rhizophaga]